MALVVTARITAGRQYHAQRCPGVPFRPGLMQPPVQGGQAKLHQVRAQPEHDRLGLRVTKSHVELQHPWFAISPDHQARVEETGEGRALLRQPPDRRLDNRLHHAFMHVGIHHGRGRISAHAPGVGPGVAIVRGFVILAGGQGQGRFAIGHDDKTGLLAGQELFDHHAVPGVAKGISGQHIPHRGFRLLLGLSDDDAFAGREAIGLDHNGRAEGADERYRRFDFRELAVGGCWNAMP